MGEYADMAIDAIIDQSCGFGFYRRRRPIYSTFSGFHVLYKRSTNKAFLFVINGNDVWIPKTMVYMADKNPTEDQQITIAIRDWWIRTAKTMRDVGVICSKDRR